MLARALWSQILDDESITRGLADPEARILVEWLVERAEQMAEDGVPPGALPDAVRQLSLRGRAIGRFVWLWCHAGECAGAAQLAASQPFSWPLPSSTSLDPCELMQFILECESDAKPQAA